jgi:hypothetical protein
MSKFINIENATIVNSVTSTGTFLTAKINNKNVGVPIYTFADPAIDLLPATPSMVLRHSTLHDQATAYDLAVTFYVETSAFATPLYKVAQNTDDIVNLSFETPTLVSNLTSTGNWLVINLEDHNYGIPLYQYSSEYIDGSLVEYQSMSSIPISTVIGVGKQIFDVTGEDDGSTYLNPKLEAYSDIVLRIKKLLGWPTTNLDICDENIADYTAQACELYTKYAGYTEEFLIFNTNLYKKGVGIRLDQLFSQTPEMKEKRFDNSSPNWDYDLKTYRKVIDCWSFEQGEGTGVNTLFTLEQAMAQQTYFSYMLGSAGFDLVTWEIMKGWLETRSKVLAQTPYFRFDPKTQLFRILPEPYQNQSYLGVIGCYVERPVRDLINEPWIWMYVQALTKIAIGQARTKFGSMVIFGGGVINGNDMLSQGLAEKKELEEQLWVGKGWVDSDQPKFFMG